MSAPYDFDFARQTAQRATVFVSAFLARDFPDAAAYLREREGVIADAFASSQPAQPTSGRVR